MVYNKYNFIIEKVVSKDTARSEIRNVFLEPNGSTATDGFKLIRVSKVKNKVLLSEEVNLLNNIKPCLISKDDCKQLSKNDGFIAIKDKKENQISFRVFNRLGETDKISVCQEGSFPKYQQLVPNKKPKASFSVNPIFLKEISEFFSKFSEKKNVKVEFFGENEAVKISCQNENQEAMALIMPLKS